MLCWRWSLSVRKVSYRAHPQTKLRNLVTWADWIYSQAYYRHHKHIRTLIPLWRTRNKIPCYRMDIFLSIYKENSVNGVIGGLGMLLVPLALKSLNKKRRLIWATFNRNPCTTIPSCNSPHRCQWLNRHYHLLQWAIFPCSTNFQTQLSNPRWIHECSYKQTQKYFFDSAYTTQKAKMENT